MSFDGRRDRIKLSDRHPVIYNGTLYAATLHRGILRGHITPYERKSMLHHIAEALRLLQMQIGNLRKENLEMILLVISNVLREDPGPDEIESKNDSLMCFVQRQITPYTFILNRGSGDLLSGRKTPSLSLATRDPAILPVS
ncbi:hypothetical protein B0A55_12016 [Friedmanniomyces simplex]|uniref:Uncharacterized protein n=1 Tax=Friedmanniomyces simplex TaxID=329884 RepID=A0A4U0WJV3_9PEZI|nr:hypothetical protein B0A55_12016 [Friedmanniomyces simplex]